MRDSLVLVVKANDPAKLCVFLPETRWGYTRSPNGGLEVELLNPSLTYYFEKGHYTMFVIEASDVMLFTGKEIEGLRVND